MKQLMKNYKSGHFGQTRLKKTGILVLMATVFTGSGLLWAGPFKINVKSYLDSAAEEKYDKKGVTAVAGVRGRMLRMPCRPHAPYFRTSGKMWITEWKLYRAKKFDEVLENTSEAGDPEGMFLRAVANYYTKGAEASKSIQEDLKKVIKDSNSPLLTRDAQRFMGLIQYEAGKYEDALESFEEMNKKKRAANIDEFSYYMMYQLSKLVDDKKKAGKLKANIEKYCGKSQLLKNID